jgi:ribonuclease H / adenosylcobalamin/alpha-ribazole phosphatase
VKVIVEADGGSRGNPGPAGYGAVVRDAGTGAVIAERSGALGHTTNNVAEYSGLIAGLRAAIELGAAEVEARLDSKLVVEQMSGRWRVRQPHLQPLAGEAAALVRQLRSVRFQWVPRERNRHADRLANEAMDAAAEGEKRPSPAAEAAQRASPAAAAETAQRASPAAAAETAPPSAWRGSTDPPTRFILLRHGQTEHSASRAYSGHGEVPLTSIGETQATLAAKRLSAVPGIAAVASSPLPRAIQTAEAVAAQLGLRVTVHDGLIEADFGSWEGLTFAQAAASDPDLHSRWLTDTSIAPPGGESFDAVRRRVRRVRDELIVRHTGSTIVVISHVAPIKTLLAMALDAWPSVLFRLHLDLASLSVAEFYADGGATVRLVNDTSHLTP